MHRHNKDLYRSLSSVLTVLSFGPRQMCNGSVQCGFYFCQLALKSFTGLFGNGQSSGEGIIVHLSIAITAPASVVLVSAVSFGLGVGVPLAFLVVISPKFFAGGFVGHQLVTAAIFVLVLGPRFRVRPIDWKKEKKQMGLDVWGVVLRSKMI